MDELPYAEISKYHYTLFNEGIAAESYSFFECWRQQWETMQDYYWAVSYSPGINDNDEAEVTGWYFSDRLQETGENMPEIFESFLICPDLCAV